jgi:hypothetical protein
MVSAKKKKYMKKYNQKPSTKEKKRKYMQDQRLNQDIEAAKDLVSFLLEQGFEDLAFEYAQEFVPEMLITAKASVSPARK